MERDSGYTENTLCARQGEERNTTLAKQQACLLQARLDTAETCSCCCGNSSNDFAATAAAAAATTAAAAEPQGAQGFFHHCVEEGRPERCNVNRKLTLLQRHREELRKLKEDAAPRYKALVVRHNSKTTESC